MDAQTQNETRLQKSLKSFPLSAQLTLHTRALLEALSQQVGEDSKREGLRATPRRYAQTLHFLTSGYETNFSELVGDAIYRESSSELVMIKDIELYSLCEHHLLPFFGHAHVAYIPNGRIIGLSKVPKLVNAFSRRLQLQERLTHQISETLMSLLQPKAAAVVIEAAHLCMMMRGVEKQQSQTLTTSFLGAFRTNLGLRNEFLSLLRI